MWHRTRVPVLVLTLAAMPAALLLGAASAAAPPGSAVTTRLATATRTPVLVKVTAASHPGYDRVVFTFSGGLPATRRAAYVPRLISDGEGAPVRLAGSAVLQVTMTGVDAHVGGRTTAPGRVVPGLPNVIEIAQSGDFEAVVGYGLGLARRQPFRIFSLTRPSRVVVDVRKDYAQVTRTVTFLDLPRSTTGFRTRAVTRVVPASAQARTLLEHLVAGPTTAERARGLRVVRSGVSDTDRVRVDAARVARLRLLGGCRSGGSTFTIANLIRPTLKPLRTVDFVKIYDPAGHTERPTGRSDSIPTCLEP